jgi:drug/metabolite transporter (DMT)-like permease
VVLEVDCVKTAHFRGGSLLPESITLKAERRIWNDLLSQGDRYYEEEESVGLGRHSPRVDRNLRGIVATVLSALLSGLAPILGKLAYQAGVDPITLVALRTALAAGLLWLIYLIFWQRYISITWRNLAGCVGMGIANGVGSLLYYSGLARTDASLAHLLYSMYPFWVFMFLSAAGHPISRTAIVRLGLALLSVFLLTWQGSSLADPLGVTLMIGAGALYGFHLVLGQWTVADVDPRTVTLYGLTTMTIVVGIPYLMRGGFLEPVSTAGWTFIVLVAIFPTALARLLVFAGLRHIGGAQTALLSVAEPLVAVLLAFVLLGESFTLQQWLGAGLFVISFLLIRRDTGLQIADEETWWQSLFPDTGAEDNGAQITDAGQGDVQPRLQGES